MIESNGHKCHRCGEFIESGIMNWASHRCNIVEFTGQPVTDNELRIFLMEIGAPDIAFTKMDILPPTEMERIVYKIDHDE